MMPAAGRVGLAVSEPALNRAGLESPLSQTRNQ
jgi:hypothetical protein